MAAKPIPLNGLVGSENGVLAFNVPLFLAAYDEFAEISEGRIRIEGDTNIALLSADAFGNFYQLAVGLMTAHRLAIAYNITKGLSDAGKNDLTSTTISTSLSASTSSLSEGTSALALTNSDDPLTADLSRTAYGLQLLGLLKAVIPAGEIVRGCPMNNLAAGAGQWPSVQGY